MAGQTKSGSNRWLIFLAMFLALAFLFKYFATGVQTLVGAYSAQGSPFAGTSGERNNPDLATEAPALAEPTAAQEILVEATQASARPVTLVVWHRWPDPQLNTYRSIFDDYSRANPNVTIEMVYQTDMQQILPTVLAAGEGPDLVIDSSSYIAQYAPNLLVPLDEYGVDWAFMNSNFRDAVTRTVYTSEHFWGLPIAQFGMGLIVNKDLVNADDNFTYDMTTFINYGQAFEQRIPGKKFICNPGFAYKDPYFLAPIIFSGGDYGGFVDVDGGVHLNHRETILAAELLPQFRDISLPNSDYTMCENAFLNDEAAIWWNGTWVLQQLQANGINYSVRGLGKPYLTTDAALVTVTAKMRNNAEIALDVARYLVSSPAQIRIALEAYAVPTSWPALEYAAGIPEGYRSFATALEAGIPLFSNRFTDIQWSPVQAALTNILDGNQSAEEALNEAQQILEGQINNLR